MNESTKTILKEMCSIVNANYEEIDFQQNDWYFLYEWTMEEQNKFTEYLINLLYENSKIRRDIMSIPSKNKELIKKTVNYFIANYGWKIKE